MGRDTGGGGNTDTIMLVAYDIPNQQLNVMSIPRDTMVNVPWDIKRINSVYNYAPYYDKDGIAFLKEEVSALIGFRPDYSVTIEWEAVGELVDAIGGVMFEVPIDMNYDGPTQDLHIHFSKGMQYLNGEDALKVVRWRQNNEPNSGYPNGDIGRIQTQQNFLITVAKQMLATLDLDMIKTYADLFVKYVDTELTVGNLVWLGQQVLTIGMDNVHFFTLPGDGTGYYKGGSYYILYPEEVLELVNSSFNPYDQPLTLEDMDILVPAS